MEEVQGAAEVLVERMQWCVHFPVQGRLLPVRCPELFEDFEQRLSG